MKKKIFALALALAGLTLTACGGTGSIGLDVDDSDLEIDTEWVDYSVPVTKVTFDDGEDSIVVGRGETYAYSYSIEPAKALKKSLSWTSSNEEVATVKDGVVTGVSVGKAVITVFNEEKSFKEISLNVEVNVPVKDISFRQSILAADYNNTYQLAVDYSPFDTTQKGVSWSIDSETFATINESGLLTTQGVTGTAKVTATSAYINKVIELTVEIDDRTIYPDAVVIDEFEPEVEIGHNFLMKAHSIVSSNEETKPTHPEVKYYSSDPTILSVEEDTGVVHAFDVGSTTIYATAQGKNGEVQSPLMTVTVFEVKVKNIILEDITLSNETKRSDFDLVKDGGFAYTTDRVGYDVASIPNFVYKIADTNVATINNNGRLYAVAEIGATTLTITETRGGATKTVDVNVGYGASSITVTGPHEVEIGAGIQLSATVSPSGVPDKYITFTSSDDSIATVDETGLVSGVSSGEVVITVNAFGAETNYKVTVKNPLPQHQYYAVGFGGDWKSIKEEYALNLDLTDLKANHYYLGPVHLTANTEIKVYDYINDKWFGSNEGYTEQGAYWKTTSEGNLIVLIEGDYYIDLFVEHKENNHIKLNYKGSPDDPVFEHQYYVEGIGGVWEAVEQYGMKDTGDGNHFNLGPIQLEAETEIKVYDVINSRWFRSNEGYTDQPKYWTTLANGNAKVLVGGDYYVDLWVDHGENNHVKLYYVNHDVPDEPGYYIVGSETNWKFEGATKLDAGEDGNLAQKIAYEAKAGEEFKVRSYDIEGGKDWYGIGEGGKDNYVVGDTDKAVNIYINSSNELYVEDYVDPTKKSYYLAGTFTNPVWDIEDELKLTVDSEDTNIYRIEDVSLNYGDIIKINDPDLGDSGWYGVDHVYDNSHFVVGENNNCIVFDKGTYDITFYVDCDDGNHIQLSLHEPQEFDLKKETKFTVINQTGKEFTGNPRNVKLHLFDITFATNSPITSVAELESEEVKIGSNVWYNATDGVIDVQMDWVTDDPVTEFTVTLPAYIESCKLCVYNSDNVWVHQVHFNEKGEYWIDGDRTIFTAYRGYNYTLYLCNNEKYNAHIDGDKFITPLSMVASFLPPKEA